MPLTSAFTIAGHLEASSRKSHGENIYHALINSLGEQYSTEIGSRSEAWAYATSMALARVRYTADRVFNQMDPRLALELLPIWETKLGSIPGFADTIYDREFALYAIKQRARIGRRAAIESALTDAIGTDFIAFRVHEPDEVTSYPADPSTPGNWIRASEPAKVVRLYGYVAVLGQPIWVRYARVDETLVDEPLIAQENLFVSANNIGLAETVLIENTRYEPDVSFRATFTKSHDIGDICTTGPMPYWISTRLHYLIVVTQAAAESRELRRKVHSVMRQMARGVATWDIVPADDDTTITAFTTDDSILGRTGYAPTGPALSY
jgi:hypothetical protein